jgi:hypothetical protein
MSENLKKINVDYSGSLVKTTKVIGWLFFVFGVIGDLFFIFSTESWHRDEIVLDAFKILIMSILWLLMFLVVSKALEHLLFMRKIAEQKSEHEGYEIKKVNDDY